MESQSADRFVARPAGSCGRDRPSRVRFGVLALLALAATTAYLTRICISSASTTIQAEFGMNNQRMGAILGAFFLGYFWFQLPTGWLGARFGGRITLTVLTLLASACSAASGLAWSAATLWVSRFGLGVAQAGLVPCTSRGVVDWFPLERRGAASSVITCCMSVGAVVATGLTARLLPLIGWRGVFFAYSAVGVIWAAAYYAWFRDRPDQHPAVNAGERDLIRRGAPGPAGSELPAESGLEAPPNRRAANRQLLRAMATSSSTWLICSQSFFRAFGAAFYLTWFPAFLEKGHGFAREAAGDLAMLPLATTVLGSLAGGVVVDVLLRRTGSRRISRSGTAVAALLSSGLGSLAAAMSPDPRWMVALLALSSFCFGMGGAAVWAAGMDISGERTQIVFALLNMCGNLGAAVSSNLVGRLFDRVQAGFASWNVVLYMFAGIYFAGAACWAFLNPNRSAVEPRGSGQPDTPAISGGRPAERGRQAGAGESPP